MTEISVLMPVYNTKPELLKDCIESILNQTFKDFELIILNDASTNNIEQTIKTFDDSRIRYYKNLNNEGITKTRNKLLLLARGKYIAISDHDDISMPERLEKEYNFLENNPDISLVSSWIDVRNLNNPKHNKIWKMKPNPKYLDFLAKCEIIHPACMWRKKDFEKYNLKYEDGYFGVQDYALFAKAIRYLNCANIQEPLLIYRKHTNNASNQQSKMCLETQKVQNEMLDFLVSEKNEREILLKHVITSNRTFKKNLFSSVNEGNYKIITIFGIKFYIKRFKTNQ